LALDGELFEESKQKKTEKEYDTKFFNRKSKSILRRSQFYKNAFLTGLLNIDYYDYTYRDVVFNNGEITYVLDFIPRKGKAKYEGTLFVSEDSYAITRVDYKYGKKRHGQKVNLRLLLGVKYIENLSEGTVIYQKDSTNIYHPKYVNRTTGSYFFVSRPLKFIENSSERYKVNFEFKIEGDNSTKEELLITNNNTLNLADFKSIAQEEKQKVNVLSKYQKSIWDNAAILEPSKEMKAFEVGE